MKKKSDFQRHLNFRPLRAWPKALPSIAIRDLLVAGFDRSADDFVFVHESNPLDILANLYPSLTLPELARLVAHPEAPCLGTPKEILKCFGLHLTPDLHEVLKALVDFEGPQQDWVSDKKVGYHELIPLLVLPVENQRLVLESLLKDSKSDGVQKIELLADLCQMGHALQDLNGKSLTELKTLRYPITAQRDQSLKSSPLPWASHVKSSFTRRGDKGGFEVQFFAGSPMEMHRTAQNLMKVADEWNSGPNKN